MHKMIDSSPCIRGTPHCSLPRPQPIRFIPVHTGNTYRNRLGVPFQFGSSPCIRGTRRDSVSFSLIRRFIPVHTGNTLSTAVDTPLESVHPRAYGEHSASVRQIIYSCGSSPCIRGTPEKVKTVIKTVRFIPVHTGNT